MPRPPRVPLKAGGPQSDLLVVEGADDFHTFVSLFDAHGIVGKCRLEDGGGYERLRDSIDARVDESGLERIGFVVDADENLGDRWRSLRDALIAAGYSAVPEAPEPTGTIITQSGKATVGMWLMPNSSLPGALEDFIRFLVPAGDPLWNYVVTSVANIPQKPEPLTGNWISKANLHTWLAWQEEPGKPIGQAITKRYLDPRAEDAQQLLAWVRLLFRLDAG